METNDKIDLVRSLLMAFFNRQQASGIAWGQAFNAEQKIREKVDPDAKSYDKRKLTVESVRKKVDLLPPFSEMNAKTADLAASVIAPNASCKFDGLLLANAQGCVEALAFVAKAYPEIADYLKCYSSVKGAKKRNKLFQDEYIETIKNDQASVDKRKSLQKWLDGYTFEGTWWGSANNMASSWGVKNRKPVKDWLAKNGQWTQANEELLEICKAARLEKEMKEYLAGRADREKNMLYVPKENKSGRWLACASKNVKSVYMSNVNGDKRDYELIMQKCEGQGFHPKRDPEHSGSMAVMVHELGHILDYMTNAREDDVIYAVWYKNHGVRMKEGLSEYADSSIAEMIAEGFAEYALCKEPREIAKTIGERLNDLYRNKYGSAHLA